MLIVHYLSILNSSVVSRKSSVYIICFFRHKRNPFACALPYSQILMQNTAALTLKRNKPRVTYKGVIKYAVYAALFIILSRAEIAPQIKPFAFGFFYALVFAGQNMLILSALYILCGAAAAPSWDAVLISSVTAGVLIIAQLIHIRLKKSVTLPFLLGYAAISQTGFLAVTILRTNNILAAVMTVIFGLIFMYTSAAVLSKIS